MLHFPFILGLVSELLIDLSVANTRAQFLGALMVDYDNRIPPNFDQNNYTEVAVSIYINSIDSINEKTMDYTMSAFIQQEWNDPRLQFFGLIPAEYLELDSKLMKEVWVPDLYFTNEKKAQFHEVTVPNRMLHLYEDGSIRYRLRVSLTAACPMNLQKYPFDSQVCSLYIQSFAYTTNYLRFVWKENDPVKTNKNLQLPQFMLDRHSVHECDGFENFTCIKLKLFLTRNLGFYMIQIYIPTVLIVLLSWVSFWLSVEAVPARISLGILTVLTITTQKTTSVVAVPPVSYVKALDVWMAVCLIFVFAALLEYAFAYVVKGKQAKERKRSVTTPIDDGAMECKVPLTQESQTQVQAMVKTLSHENDRAIRIDNFSKIIFPIVFTVFLMTYWIAYLV